MRCHRTAWLHTWQRQSIRAHCPSIRLCLHSPSPQGFDAFKATLETAPGSGTSRVDLVLSCVDNYEARMTINQVGHAVGTVLCCAAGEGGTGMQRK